MNNNHTRAHDLCDSEILERPRYFPRQMITAEEMALEQKYFRDKLRRHNRFLHGWGVVCGAEVCLVPATPNTAEPWKVKIKPGYILGPYGDEIVIDCEHTVDLRTCGVTGVTGEPKDMPDPWCTDVVVDRNEGELYVAVRYKEVMTRPVRVQPVGCGCDDAQCEYSRWRDGYETGCLATCPETHETPPRDIISGPNPECPPCPSSPWVVLAKVEFDSTTGIINTIDNCSCRRLVVAFGHFWWRCTNDENENDRMKKEAAEETGETLAEAGKPVVEKIEEKLLAGKPTARASKGRKK